jgi:hypothetical protein
MSVLGQALLAQLDADDLRELADALAPYLSGRPGSDGWMGAQDAVAYLGLGSLDALDRLVGEGLPCSQPSGPGGRRRFQKSCLDAWMEGRS